MSNEKKPNKPKALTSGSLKATESKRRQVFKPILENPYTISKKWPFIEQSTARTILELLESVLSPVGNHNEALQSAKSESERNQIRSNVPKVLREVTIGFNSTTNALENQSQMRRRISQTKKPKQDSKNTDRKNIRFVFVAKADMGSSVLSSSFPVLTYTASDSKKDLIKLIALPRGSTTTLSRTLKCEDCSVLGLTSNMEEAKPLYEILEKIEDLELPWLDYLFEPHCSTYTYFEKPSIQMVQTSAPIIKKQTKTT
ncbi:Piso0_000524 [Millerozyma farinosa CBS 7064]|uniref:Piso0_000524 protein n=1 Tax=Pichia sorbitophila (strain ATCC MYA-4447 / BCRC 22081 / CBS 7064 / NBRC 10061 / NRRL Y-12695) TaxID=559304 RepID=G8YVN8_PICSO|nr:Piso0_000524 [Millerozyma farinosa CBS 7064]CCE73482.1 Piso0_000524 [Millerozyma farinosa CBS 7064]